MRFKDGDRVEDETKSRGTVEDIEEIGEDTFYSVAWDISGCQSTFKVGDELDATMKLVNPDDPEPNPYEVELRKIAVTLGEGEDPFAAWESLDLIMTEHADQKKVIESLTQKLEALRGIVSKPVGYLIEHEKETKDFQWAPLTPADKKAGFKETPLYTAAPTPVSHVAGIDWFETCLNVVHEHKKNYVVARDELRQRGKANAALYANLIEVCDSISQAIHDLKAMPNSPPSPEARPEGLDELEILARAATPGPHHVYTYSRDDNNWRANEEFHKAATPQIVLWLLALAK